MRVPRAASRGANLCLLLLLLLHLSGTLARSYWGHNRGAGGQRRGGGHQGRRNMGRHRRKDQLIHPTSAEIPYFDPTSPTHIKAQLGSNAYLPCKIKNLGNKSVSWVRNKDAHILSVDRYTFIADARFATWHEAITNTWTLQVKYVKASDAGRYECQVSTEPKMSHFVHLNVITPLVTIPGGSELHVRSGSTVTIKCVVSQALHPPSYVFWYHGEQRIPEGKWKGVTQQPLTIRASGGSEAALTVTSANHAHAGNYTCAPAALTPVSVILHVLNGERPAAMQHGTSTSSLPSLPSLPLLLLFTLLLLHLAPTDVMSSSSPSFFPPPPPLLFSI
ncbi:hemicentin-2-like [Portunus trituberculatus]|uniref:hemicentin-2-like n=1 Tax=Portunus trituberculatus TaxID=210409 RepID=UPI001E1D1159|nr:hemicentin-2-like [Portunus trituberculatus]XP_045126945.1 hemicentin-2-like [Portunus trituberculatus]